MISFSFIIPVFNRPDEIRELLESLVNLKFESDFEVVIVEDGSTISSETIIMNFAKKLNLAYYQKPNSGPGDSRNFGMERARGNYFIILDSDCLLPPHYLKVVSENLETDFAHCFGGPDAAHESFSPLQKAINYVMTSFLTTGGIRGGRKQIQQFEPRSFNLGLSQEAFEATGGFGKIHPGEDPDLVQRLWKKGFTTTFIPQAFVYHKRRISWKKFYQQVKKFGLTRPILNKWHPSSAKISFWFPTVFIFGVVVTIVIGIFYPLAFVPLGIYLLTICLNSAIKNKSFLIGIYSVIALFIQFFGYGWAFLRSYITIHILDKDPENAFPFLFFK